MDIDKLRIFSEIFPQDRERHLRQLEEFNRLDPTSQFTVFCLRKAETKRRAGNWIEAVEQGDEYKKILIGDDWDKHDSANYSFYFAMSDEAKELELANFYPTKAHRHTIRGELKKLFVSVAYFGLINERYSP